MKIFRKIMVVMLAAALIAMPVFAEEAASEAEEATVDLSNLTIGACVMSFEQEFMADLVTGYEEFMKDTNINMILTDGGNNEPAKQVTNVENYIASGVDGILCQCISIETMKDTLKNAIDSGIPVGIYPYDRSANVTTYFGYDEYEWGKSLGEDAVKWIADQLGGTATVLCLGSTQEESAIARCEGMKDAVFAVYSEDEVEWLTQEAVSSEDAMSVVESSLQAHPDIDLVLVYNDEMAVGAYQAVEQSGLDTSTMYVGSCDGTSTVLDLIKQDNCFRCTVGNDRYVTEIGYYWVENMCKIILGMEYEDPFRITTIAINDDNVIDYTTREPNFVLHDDFVEYVNSL